MRSLFTSVVAILVLVLSSWHVEGQQKMGIQLKET